MTPEQHLILVTIGTVALTAVALFAIVAQNRTIRHLSQALAAVNRHLTAAAIVSHPSHQAMIARRLVAVPATPTDRDDDDSPLDVHKGVTFAEGGT